MREREGTTGETFADAYRRLVDRYPDPRARGHAFERLVARALRSERRFGDVWLWADWPGSAERDLGIDIVARRQDDGALVAVQCKDQARISKGDLDSFIANSARAFGGERFAERLVVTPPRTAWSRNAEIALKGLDPPVAVRSLGPHSLAELSGEEREGGEPGVGTGIGMISGEEREGGEPGVGTGIGVIIGLVLLVVILGLVFGDDKPTAPRHTAPAATPEESLTPSITPEPTVPSSASPRLARTYTVRAGDFCWRIAEEHGVTMQALREANPRIDAACGNLGVGWDLVIPGDGAAAPLSTPPASRPSGTYTVRAGDFCWRIAEERGVTTQALRAANPRIDAACGNLVAGWDLVIPTASVTPEPTVRSPAELAPDHRRHWLVRSRTYTVRAGDVCWRIAEERGVTTQALRAANPRIDAACGNLVAGWDLVIPTASVTPEPTVRSPAAVAPPHRRHWLGRSRTYAVRVGDVCWRIAEEHGVTTQALREANPRIDADCGNLGLGWELVIPGDGAAGAEASPPAAPSGAR